MVFRFRVNITKVAVIVLAFCIFGAIASDFAIAASPAESRQSVKKAIYTYTKTTKFIANEKIVWLFERLDKDGYFNKNRAQKLAYIHANRGTFVINGVKILDIVAQAEGLGGTPVVASSGGADKTKKLLDEANNNLKIWTGFFNHIFYPNGRLDTTMLRNNDGNAYGIFTAKHKWTNKDLDTLYDKFWPEFKKAGNRKKNSFTCDEVKILNKIWNKRFASIAKKFPPTDSGLRPIGIFGDSPIDDVLVFVPVEKIASIAGKAFIATAKASRYRPVSVAAQIAERAPARIVSAVQNTAKVATRWFTVESRFLGKVSVDLYEMFGHSNIPTHERDKIAMVFVRTASNIANSPFKKYFKPEWISYIIRNTEVVSSHELPPNVAGVCKFIHGGKIACDEAYVAASYRSGNAVDALYAHEIFHGMTWPRDRLFYGKPNENTYTILAEGMTERLSKRYVRGTHGVGGYDTYQNNVNIVKEIEDLITRKHGEALGSLIGKNWIAQTYFTIDKHFQSSLDTELGKGFYSGLARYLEKPGREDFKGAVKYLRNYRFP